jgi:hypothetical protein
MSPWLVWDFEAAVGRLLEHRPAKMGDKVQLCS